MSGVIRGFEFGWMEPQNLSTHTHELRSIIFRLTESFREEEVQHGQ